MKIVVNIDTQREKELFLILKHIINNYKHADINFFTSPKHAAFTEHIKAKIATPYFINNLHKRIWYLFVGQNILTKLGNPPFLQAASAMVYKSYSNLFLFVSSVNELSKSTLVTLQKATHIFTTEDFVTDLLIKKYSIPQANITTTYYQPILMPISEAITNTNQIKDTYCDGADYFFCEINSSVTPFVLPIIKAFSQFKKWQKSSIKLVLYLDADAKKNDIPSLLSYKYKADVVCIDSKSVQAELLIKAAFGVMYFSAYRMQHIAHIAFNNNVPVIAHATSLNKSIFKQAAYYCTVDSLATAMQQIYKDDVLYNSLNHAASIVAAQYTIENAAHKIMTIFNNYMPKQN